MSANERQPECGHGSGCPSAGGYHDSGSSRTTAGETIRVAVDAASARAGDRITLGVRPEHLNLSAEGDALTAEVLFVEPLGATTMAHLKHAASQETLTVQLASGTPCRVGESLTLQVPADQAHLFDAEGRAFSRL